MIHDVVEPYILREFQRVQQQPLCRVCNDCRGRNLTKNL